MSIEGARPDVPWYANLGSFDGDIELWQKRIADEFHISMDVLLVIYGKVDQWGAKEFTTDFLVYVSERGALEKLNCFSISEYLQSYWEYRNQQRQD